MKDSVIVGTFLFFAFVFVSCDCRRVKRQDLIPFPRVGKRAWTRDDDVMGTSNVASLVAKVLEQDPSLGTGPADQDSWMVANTYPRDPKSKGMDATSDVKTFLKSLLNRRNEPTGHLSLSSRTGTLPDHKISRKVIRKGLRTFPEASESSGLSSVLVHQLLDHFRDKTPEAIANLLQSKLSSQDTASD